MESVTGTIAHPGAVAVITGAASGIGLAAANYLASKNLSIVLVDVAPLDAAEKSVKAAGAKDTLAVKCDVSSVTEVLALREKVMDTYGEVQILLNNAGIARPCPAISLTRSVEDLQKDWNAVLGTNARGIFNVAQVFGPDMARQENSSVIINTGSKQGITNPPGNGSGTAYNVSKAAVKTFTEQLAYELRNLPECECTAHLFVPGWVHTGIGGPVDRPKAAGSWTPEQTVEYMFEKVLEEGDFYVICPDNDTPASLDKARMQWAADDVIQNRVPLSRWHPEYSARYDEFVMNSQGLSARSRSRGRPDRTHLGRVQESSPYPPENKLQPSAGEP